MPLHMFICSPEIPPLQGFPSRPAGRPSELTFLARPWPLPRSVDRSGNGVSDPN